MAFNLGSVRAPPVLEEDGNYDNYVKEIRIWQLLKVCTKQEEGPLIFKTLKGKAKDAALTLDVAQIGSETGLEQILTKLNAVFLADKNQRTFIALDSFEKYKRPPSVTISDFMMEFQKRQSKVESFNCKYPDGVLAYKLLKAANISNEHEKMCRATIKTGEWSLQSVTDQLHKIFNDIPTVQCSNQNIKVEDVFHTNAENVPIQRPISHHQYYTEDNFEYEDQQSYSPGPRFIKRELPNQYYDQQGSESLPYDEGYDIYYGSRYRRPFRPNFNRPKYPPSNLPNRKIPFKSTYNSSVNTPNPKDARGNYTTCRKCHSIMHWIQDCPHASPEDNVYYTTHNSDDVYIEVMQSSVPFSYEQYTSLVSETFNRGVIDSGCAKTCCGKGWYETYLETLSEEQVNKIQSFKSQSKFRFGDSQPITAEKKVLLPMTIAEKDILVETEVVPCDIPLLLSKDTMKKLKAKQDYENDTICIFDKKIDMICTNTGHYAVPICKNTLIKYDDTSDKIVVLFNLEGNCDVKSIAKKLHQQFSHPSADRLIKYIRKAGVENDELFSAIGNISDHCDTCKKYSKVRPRPSVTFPLATEFNDTVAIDLKIFKNNEIYFFTFNRSRHTLFCSLCYHIQKERGNNRQYFQTLDLYFRHPSQIFE